MGDIRGTGALFRFVTHLHTRLRRLYTQRHVQELLVGYLTLKLKASG